MPNKMIETVFLIKCYSYLYIYDLFRRLRPRLLMLLVGCLSPEILQKLFSTLLYDKINERFITQHMTYFII